MNKSYRIRTEVGTNASKHIKLRLDQEFDSFEILSLNIDQKDVYQNFNCNYGVVVGRVNANGGVGISNARLSIFIPITDEDSLRPEIKAIYPYKSPRDKNNAGKRYNLLPRVGRTQTDGTVKPSQPFGSFPLKEEFVTNNSWLEVYDTYYKYSTITNDAGDFMLFGVPVGTQTVHMSVDITDIGKYSMTPAAMVTNLGYSPNLFTNNNTKIKPSRDLDDLPHIETQEISVDVIPFCGDSENFDIGITRQDFRIRAILIPTFTVFGAAMSDGQYASRGQDFDGNKSLNLWRVTNDGNINVSIGSKRNGIINPDIVTISPDVDDADTGTKNSLNIYENGTFDPINDCFVLGATQYTSIVDKGQFVFLISCNRRKVITDEFGNEIVVANDSVDGVFTEWRGAFIFRMDDPELLITPDGYASQRVKYKIPQTAIEGETFLNPSKPNATTYNDKWRKQHFKFEANKFYSVSKFQSLSYKDGSTEIPNVVGWDPFGNVGIIVTDDLLLASNSSFQFPQNTTQIGSNRKGFGAEWLNFTAEFQQYGNGRGHNEAAEINANMVKFDDEFWFIDDAFNQQEIMGTLRDTKYFMRSDRNKTTFCEVPIPDILNIIDNITTKGFRTSDFIGGTPLIGVYPSTTSEAYFYKGLFSVDCISNLRDLGLI